MRYFALTSFAFLTIQLAAVAAYAGAQEKAAEAQQSETKTSDVSPELIEKFKVGLTNTKFVGQFTVDGLDRPAKKEEYTVTGVKKLDTGDWWELTARIKYVSLIHI